MNSSSCGYVLHKASHKGISRCSRVVTATKSRSGQSIKVDIDLSIDKSIKIGKSDLIDIDWFDQSVEMDDTLVSFIDLSRFLPISSIHIGRNIYSSKN